MGGSLAPVRVAGFTWNGWQPSAVYAPLIYVRDRLGHSSITTTEKYLHFLDDIEDDLRTSYQEEIEETARKAACA